MAGAPPYSSRSPSQSHYPSYSHSHSPPDKNRPLYYNGNEPPAPPHAAQQQHHQYSQQQPQHAPQTPPAAVYSSSRTSPRFAHPPSPMNTSALASMNGAIPPPEVSPKYPHAVSPQHQHHSMHSHSHSHSRVPSYPQQQIPSKMPLQYDGPPSSHAHPQIVQDIPAPPPRYEEMRDRSNGHGPYGPPAPHHPVEAPAETKPARVSNPMSFASILSGPTEERAPAPPGPPAPPTPSTAPISQYQTIPTPPTPAQTQASVQAQGPPPPPAREESPMAISSKHVSPVKPVEPVKLAPQPRSESPAPLRANNFVPYTAPAPATTPTPAAESTSATTNGKRASKASKRQSQGKQQLQQQQQQQQRRTLTDQEQEKINKHMAEIDEQEKSDLEDPSFAPERKKYASKTKKRAGEIEEQETTRRKRRKVAFIGDLASSFTKESRKGNNRFRKANESKATAEVHETEVREEKERKKDMQRKRRRENTVRQEEQKKREAEARAQEAEDEVEREKYLREAEKASRKIKSTQRAMERGDAPADEISEVQPMALNLEGGTTSTFPLATRGSPAPEKKRRGGRSGGTARPRKSKEKKQAEKNAAEAAFAAGLDHDELVTIAPKDTPRKEAIKKEGKVAKSKEPSPVAQSPFETKGYLQIYDQIWRDMARKDVPKVYRIKTMSLGTKQENLRKTAQLAGKQARKWQERTNKNTKDTQARAKRSMREMMSFWKRNEREERDLRRMAEKQELEKAKQAEADREANRQKRKLNFLISQTELYSHFIGRKIKTDEIENSTNDGAVATTDQTVRPGKPDAHPITVSNASAGANLANIEDLDFDEEDESQLQEIAMARAQNAVQEAQDRARAFNGEDPMASMDEGELNFQNPTSLGDVQVSQPKMLTAQLKEYQLKGLNWLVNLYEQGINGILADEMGLGKTVQSISVLGYLAEVHNIWGPFLVIAPASTLHNWQQEITRFVPDIKVLPYWGSAKDRKVLRKFWDRKHITYTKESEFHVLVTSYQLVVQDTQYFQKVKWQYMILDEAQAIKSSQSSRWKNLLAFSCRNRLLLTGTPIQNNMQELWALLHFIMPTLFDSHDEFSDWFSKDIESHAQSNTKLNEDQLKRLHMILKPFMLRRVKKHVQKELGDKVEKDVFCDLTYRQRAYYANLRNRINITDLIEKAAVGDDQDTATLMNLVMQFRKVCNHPDLFERADTKSPFSMSRFAETASFLREGSNVDVGYSVKSVIDYDLPRMLCNSAGRIDMAGPNNDKAGFRNKYLSEIFNIWTPENIRRSSKENSAFAFLRFADVSLGEASKISHTGLGQRAIDLKKVPNRLSTLPVVYDDEEEEKGYTPAHALFNIVERNDRQALADITLEGRMKTLMNVSADAWMREGFGQIEQCAWPSASAPPVSISCSDQNSIVEREKTLFNVPFRQAMYGVSEKFEEAMLVKKVEPKDFPVMNLLPKPLSSKSRYTNITVPSMRRFVTDSGKLAQLDRLLTELKNGGHRVLLYFQMTRMIDLMEEYLTYRNYKYCRLDGSTKLEDRRDTVHDFQTRPEIFVFLLSTRAGGLGINLTTADTVIFYDSDWNPTIDSQAMDRAHRLGQTKQVTVYRLITRNTIEERIRKRAMQKEEVQRVVISGGSGAGVDFNTRSKENRTKDIAMWLADDDEAELLEQKSREAAEKEEALLAAGGAAAAGGKKASKKAASAAKRKRDLTMDDMYHEGEGNFDDASAKPSGAATPMSGSDAGSKMKKGPTGKAGKGAAAAAKRAKIAKERLRVIDGEGDLGLGGGN